MAHEKQEQAGVTLECAWGDCAHDGDCPTTTVETCKACSDVRFEQAEHADEPPPVVLWEDAEARGHVAGQDAWDWAAS